MHNIKINDLNISYLKKGSSKKTMIFLHGWGQDKNSFIKPIEYFSKKYTVYSIDFPGFGESEEPIHSEYDLYDYVDIFEQFLKELNINDPIVIGHSFGCRVAITYFGDNESSQKLILTGAAGLLPKRTIKYKFAVANYKVMKFLVKTPFYCHYKDDLFANSGSSDYKNASEVMKKVLIKVVNEDLKYYLGKIKNDTLLFWGENDDQTPVTDGYIMEKSIKNASLVIQENAGHFAFLEYSDNFIKEIENFIKK